ncbi:MAG: L-lactate dehydrogenase [Candidatus Omnitrophica bacterium]|nr:L-lactate dehydrogenase [Candidatus Omnitrophota bacterium]
MLKPKVAIIGAGNVGIRYAYSLMISGLARSIVILDLDKERSEGEVMDLASGMPYISPVHIAVGGYPDLEGCDLVVVTAGKKQKPGQTRLELVKDNVEIYKNIIPQIIRYAQKAILLIVSNPVDVLSYAAYKISGKPWNEVIGSGTVLDSARFRFLLSHHCNIDAHNIHAYILGEHGDSEFPALSKAMIGGVFLEEHCPVCNRCDHQKAVRQIFEDVRDFAYKIIEKKGETSYGIGLALVRITQAVLKDENSILPVSCLVNGYYGGSDVYMSLPAVVNKNGVREILDLKLNDEEVGYLKKSAQVIRETIRGSGL